MTSHDITFCANSEQCPKAPTCRRAHPPTDVVVSVVDYYKPQMLDFDNTEMMCLFYWPTGEMK
jgi:hypothetical protein